MDNKVTYDASIDASMEERSSTNTIRKENRIESYTFNILIRDKKSLVGKFTREEMNLVYQLYSSEGAGLTQKEVSREFGEYTFQDFKKILRAFSITRASAPLAPHIIEERTTEDLVKLTLQNKENTYLRKLEQERNRLTERSLKDITKKYHELKREKKDFEDILANVDIPYTTFFSKQTDSGVDLVIYLSDMHIGAYNSSEGVFDNPYDKNVIISRLNEILEEVQQLTFNNIIIMDLGDAIDGYNAQTTRSSSTHILPQNMSNKEQANTYIEVMLYFFNALSKNLDCNNIKFYSVGQSNHGGDFEYSIKVAFSYLLKNMGIESRISTRPIDHFKLGDKTIVFLHGKDNVDQFKNFPLTVNEKMENYFNHYLHQNNITGDVLIVKGDLHQSATTKAKRFKYKSVASLFGSSNWIHANFGLTPWGCDYSLINRRGRMLDGLIE